MRKTKTITINDRGTAKTFRITEMPATKIERWLIAAGRLLLSCGAGDVQVGNLTDSGEMQEALARFLVTDGLRCLGNLDMDKTWPLYDELLGCCEIKIGDYFSPLSMDTVDGQIEDFRTLLALRKEALLLHLDFFKAGSPSGSTTPGAAAPGANSLKPVISAG